MLNDVETLPSVANSTKKQRNHHPNQLANLALGTWKKGQSGNPKGKPKGTVHRSTVYERVLNTKVNVTLPDNTETKLSYYEAIALGQCESAREGNTRAWQEIQDSLHGKIPTQHTVTPTEELREAVAALRELNFVLCPADPTDNSGAIDVPDVE